MTQERSDQIVATLTDAFTDLIAVSPGAFRSKFRTMAREPSRLLIAGPS